MNSRRHCDHRDISLPGRIKIQAKPTAARLTELRNRKRRYAISIAVDPKASWNYPVWELLSQKHGTSPLCIRPGGLNPLERLFESSECCEGGRLRSAHAAYTAASALAQAAAATYDAALDACRAGLGSLQVATAADSGLQSARIAQSEAHAAALVAAANLAFVPGAMTSRDMPAQLIAR
jgi:hypothetical protein